MLIYVNNFKYYTKHATLRNAIYMYVKRRNKKTLREHLVLWRLCDVIGRTFERPPTFSFC